MKFKRFVVTERDKKLIYKHLPNPRSSIVDALKKEGWPEKTYIRTLIWYMQCHGDIYMHKGIIKKTQKKWRVENKNMTSTCCLDCGANPCPIGWNCRDNTVPKWCEEVGGEATCLGDCEHFKRRVIEVIEEKG